MGITPLGDRMPHKFGKKLEVQFQEEDDDLMGQCQKAIGLLLI